MTAAPADDAGAPKGSWLPRDRAEPLPADAPDWVPPGFAGARIAWDTLSYIVVDELSTEVAGLVVSGWPRLDQRGRVRHPGPAWRVGALLAEFDAALAARVLPKATADPERVRTRVARIGDAFAARVERPRGRVAAVPKLSRWLTPPIYDISADARDAAKAALFGALAPTMSPDDVAEIASEALDLAE